MVIQSVGLGLRRMGNLPWSTMGMTALSLYDMVLKIQILSKFFLITMCLVRLGTMKRSVKPLYDANRYQQLKAALDQIQPHNELMAGCKATMLEILEYRRELHNLPPDIGLTTLFQLRSLTFIPEALHTFPGPSFFTCPLSREPIRFAVKDSTNNLTIYNRTNIEDFLALNPTSPMTRRPLFKEQLLPVPDIQVLIERHLARYENEIVAFLRFYKLETL